MGLNRTVTGLTHYDIQNRRRKAKHDEARAQQRFIIHRSDVELLETERGFRSGCYIGVDGDRPTKLIDCYVHEVDPGVVSTIHRHSWDAVMICFEGHGWAEVDGVRYDYKPWDTVYLPSWAWHRQGNDGTRTAKFMTIGCEPETSLIGLSVLEDAGKTPFADLPPPPTSTAAGAGADPYARRKRRLSDAQQAYRTGRIHVAYEDLTLLVNPKGTRSTFMLDEFLGSKTSGLTVAMNQIAPGKYQKKHRHGGEAYLYAIEGRGHSVIDGVRHDWEEGDLVIVDHFAWHQHFNSDPELTARLVRVHTTAGIMDAMRGLLDPLVISEEEPGSEPDVTTVIWPPDRRPD
jgi:gentisate 1,2-dioxygenase